MFRMVRGFGAALALTALVGVAQADITPIPEPFECDATEGFEGPQVVFTPCVVPPLPQIFDGGDNLCTPGASGCHTTGSWGFRCSIQRRSGSLFFGSAGGFAQYTFDPPVCKFGGYFGSNAANPGEDNDAAMTFYDAGGNVIGTGLAVTGHGDCQWHWNGWTAGTNVIAKIDVVGKLFGGAFIDMDDMCIAYCEGEDKFCEAECTKVKAKRCNVCPQGVQKSTTPCDVDPDCRPGAKGKVKVIACPDGQGGKCKYKKCKLTGICDP